MERIIYKGLLNVMANNTEAFQKSILLLERMWRKGKAHTLPVGTPVDEATLSHSVISNSATLWTAACQAPVHGIFLARILEWVVISSSRATS